MASVGPLEPLLNEFDFCGGDFCNLLLVLLSCPFVDTVAVEPVSVTDASADDLGPDLSVRSFAIHSSASSSACIFLLFLALNRRPRTDFFSFRFSTGLSELVDLMVLSLLLRARLFWRKLAF